MLLGLFALGLPATSFVASVGMSTKNAMEAANIADSCAGPHAFAGPCHDHPNEIEFTPKSIHVARYWVPLGSEVIAGLIGIGSAHLLKPSLEEKTPTVASAA